MTNSDIEAFNYGRRSTDTLALHKVAPDDIIEINGKYGLFTPLTDTQESEAGSQRNLDEIVEMLRQEIATLKSDNVELKEQLRQTTEKPIRTPDEFVTAIQHSVDSLQGKLAEMKNPVSDFVVSEFNLDTHVFIDVSQFGTIDYRFVQPGDDLDPALLSNISLKIKPVPKQTQTGSFDRTNFTPYEDVDEIQGIGDVYKEKLRANNIFTVSDLLHAGTRVRSRVELASLLGVEQRSLGEWLGNAELMTVKDIDGRAAEVLFEIGVTNLENLAVQQPEELLTRYNQRVTDKDHESLKPASQDQVNSWIRVAKLYVGKTQQEQAATTSGAESGTKTNTVE